MNKIHKLAFLGLAAAALTAASGLSPVAADNVQYTTVGAFTAGTGATAIPNGLSFTDGASTLQLVFAAGSGNLNTPVVSDLGTFTLNLAGPGSVTIPTAPTLSTFSLTINQTVPSAGSGVLTSKLSGTVGFNSGFVEVKWDSPTDTTIGPVNYRLVNLTNGIPGFQDGTLLLDPTATGGITKVSAFISTPHVPEPASMMLAGLGLASLAGLRRRR